MDPWVCGGCGCEYQWSDPTEKHGHKLCTVCVDSPEILNKLVSTKRISNGWCFAFGILVGMVVTKILFVPH